MSGIDEVSSLKDETGHLRIWCFRDIDIFAKYLIEDLIPQETVAALTNVFFEGLSYRRSSEEVIKFENLKRVARQYQVLLVRTARELETAIAYYEANHRLW